MSDSGEKETPAASTVDEVKAAPETPVEKAPEPEPQPAATAPDNGLKDTVDALAKTVEGLVQTVTAMTQGKDESPVKVPWTHRGGKR
jgi:hypothetical protein